MEAMSIAVPLRTHLQITLQFALEINMQLPNGGVHCIRMDLHAQENTKSHPALASKLKQRNKKNTPLDLL